MNDSKSHWAAYYLTKLILGLGLTALAAFDLQSPEVIPTVVYALIAGLAGGPELVAAVKGLLGGGGANPPEKGP